MREKVSQVPIFARVANRQLVLANYPLNSGICLAMGTYLQLSVRRVNQSFILKRLVLENNNLHDEDFANMLAGLKHQKKLEALVFSSNEFGQASVKQLEELLLMQPKQGFKQIMLTNLRIKPAITRLLVAQVLPLIASLQHLKISSIDLTEPTTSKSLASLLAQTNFLEFLDLSHCRLLPQ